MNGVQQQKKECMSPCVLSTARNILMCGCAQSWHGQKAELDECTLLDYCIFRFLSFSRRISRDYTVAQHPVAPPSPQQPGQNRVPGAESVRLPCFGAPTLCLMGTFTPQAKGCLETILVLGPGSWPSVSPFDHPKNALLRICSV